MSIPRAVIDDKVEEFLALPNYADYLDDVIYWDSVNIFKAILNKNLELIYTYKEDTLSTILNEDKSEMLELFLKSDSSFISFLKDYILEHTCVLKKDCFGYILDSHIFPFNMSDDHLLLESIENDVESAFHRLVDIYNYQGQSLSKNGLEVLFDLEDSFKYISYFINNFYLKDEDITRILNFNFSDQYTLAYIVEVLFEQQKYYLINNRFFQDCLDNDFYNVALLLIDLNIDISVNGNQFLNMAISENDFETFYFITKHDNFNPYYLNIYNFEEIFINEKFGFSETKYLIDIYMNELHWDYYKNEIPDYMIRSYDDFQDIVLSSITNNRLNEFKALFHSEPMSLLFHKNCSYKDEILEKSLISESICSYLFRELNEYTYLESLESNIIELFEHNPKTLPIILEREKVVITKSALIKAALQHNEGFLYEFLNHSKISSFEDLNFILIPAAENRNHKILNLLLDSNMTQLNSSNIVSVAMSAIQTENLEAIDKIISNEVFKNCSLNGLAYCAAQYSKNTILSHLVKNERYTDEKDSKDHPLEAIINKSKNSFSWNSYENNNCIETLIDHKDYKVQNNHIVLLKQIMESDSNYLFNKLLNLILSEWDISFSDSLYDVFSESFKFSDKFSNTLFNTIENLVINQHFKFEKNHIFVLLRIMNSKSIDNFNKFLQLIKSQSDSSFLETINKMFCKSFDHPFEFTESLFNNFKIDVNYCSKSIYSNIESKSQNQKYNDIFTYSLKNIDNIDIDTKYLLFKKICRYNFECSLILFKDGIIKKRLIENDKVIYENFNKQLIKHSAEIF